MFTDHHGLASYQKSKQLVLKIIEICNSNPKKYSYLPIFQQIIRSSSSIGANIAEGYGRNNQKEYKQYLGIARGSSFETEYWLEILQESLNMNFSDIINLNKEIIKILTVTIRNLSDHSGP